MLDMLGDHVAMGREIAQGSAEELTKFNPRILVMDTATHAGAARRAAAVARTASLGGTTVIIIVCTKDTDLGARAQLRTRYSADFCVDDRCDEQHLLSQLDRALATRTPFADFGLLPADVAERLDDMERAMPNGSYYELLGITSRASHEAVRTAFQHVSRWTHPDRHRRLRVEHPVGYQRLQNIHKRLTEAHSVLSRPRHRALYNTCLRRGGSLRYVGEQLPKRIRDELNMAKSPAGKDAISQCIEARSLGRWNDAASAMALAVTYEPSNTRLMRLETMVQHVARIAAEKDGKAGAKMKEQPR
ncbi:MAG: DnaJ domain-containing protein [Myxococcota bacterium]|nr:DnaJ domain-containing protein [Myxococcota bacterium]